MENMNKETQIFNYLLEKDINDFIYPNVISNIVPLRGDASVRKYYRAAIINDTETYTIIITLVEPYKGDAKNYPQLNISNFLLQNGICIPKVLYSNLNLGLIIQEDIGDTLLESIVQNVDFVNLSLIFSEIIKDLIKIHSLKYSSDCIAFNYSFDFDKLMYEFNFFIEHLLEGYYKAVLDNDDKELLLSEFKIIAKYLAEINPKVFTHRDFHSRNIMQHNSNIYYIDYQDARLGIMQYDLVSLLRDSYVFLPEKLTSEMCLLYYNLSKEYLDNPFSYQEFLYQYDIMAFQRNIKACGTFGYQASSFNNYRYVDSLYRTYKYLIKDFTTHSELNKIYNILKKYIGELY